MTSSTPLSGLGFSAFVARVADRASTPGAGSVAAAVGALGAGLASMAFRHVPGEGAGAYAAGRADELDELSSTLLRLVDADAEAYAAWRASRAATAATPDAAAESARKAAEQALEVPLEIMEASVAALRLLAVGVGQVSAALHCECLTAARSLEAAVESAGVVVAENLTACAGAAANTGDLERTRRQLLETAAELSAEILGASDGDRT